MKKIIALNFSLLSLFSFAQIKQGEANVRANTEIKEGEATVYRRYEPNVEAIEKIKQTPQVEAPVSKPNSFSYQPRDIEASSDFRTTTIQAEEMTVENSSLYPSYVRLGIGNNTNVRANGFFNYQIDEASSTGLNASYYTSKANIKNQLTSTHEGNFKAEGFYKMNWDGGQAKFTAGGGLHQLHLYGIPTNTGLTHDQIENVEQQYVNLHAGASYQGFGDYNYIQNAHARVSYLSDDFDSKEFLVNANTHLNSGDLYEADFFGGVRLGGKTGVDFDVVSSQFKEISQKNEYTFLNVGASPQLTVHNDLFSLEGGVKVQYINEMKQKNSQFYVFPHAQIKLKAVPEFGIYAGVTGGAELNSFHSLKESNPYLFPEQVLKPTVNKLEFYGGIAGNLGQNFRYHAKAGFQNMENLMFFEKAPFEYVTTMPFYSLNNHPYSYANAFTTTYSDGTRSYLEGKVDYIGIEKLDIGAYFNFQSFDLDKQDIAWLQPKVSGGITAKYSLLNEQLLLGGNLFFVGDRTGNTYTGTVGGTSQIVTLKSYLDANLSAEYLINDRWSIFVEGNNLLNKNYQRFTDYRVQGWHVLGGFQFKF